MVSRNFRSIQFDELNFPTIFTFCRLPVSAILFLR